MSEFSELFYKDHAHYDLLFKSLQIYHKNATTTTTKQKRKKQNKAKQKKICSSSIAFQHYWSSEQVGLELKVWMSTFLNIRTSRPEVSCKKGVLKMIILQNSLKNNLYAVFNLIKFQAKVFQLYWEETPAYALFVERRKKYLLKFEIAAPDKFTEAAVCGCFSK